MVSGNLVLHSFFSDIFNEQGRGPKGAMSCRMQENLVWSRKAWSRKSRTESLGQALKPGARARKPWVWARPPGSGSLDQGVCARRLRPGGLGQKAWARKPGLEGLGQEPWARILG